MGQCDNTIISSFQPQLSPEQYLSTSLFVFDQLHPTFSMAQLIASLLTLSTKLAAAAAQSTCYLISLVHATNLFSTSTQLLPWRARSSSPHHHRGPCSISLLPLEVASPIFLLFFFTFSISLSADPSLCLENCRLSSQSYPLIQCTPSGVWQARVHRKPIFVNKIWLEYSHAYLFIYCLQLLLCWTASSWVVVTEITWLTKPKRSALWPFVEKIVGSSILTTLFLPSWPLLNPW